jgi:hypothetical protein
MKAAKSTFPGRTWYVKKYYYPLQAALLNDLQGSLYINHIYNNAVIEMLERLYVEPFLSLYVLFLFCFHFMIFLSLFPVFLDFVF